MRSKESLIPPPWILTLIACAAIAWLALALKDILVLLVVGYSIAYVIHPWLDSMERKRIPRSIGVVIILLFLVLSSVLLAISAAPTISREAQRLADGLPSYLAIVKVKIEPLAQRVEALLPTFFGVDQTAALMDKLGAFLPDFLRKVVNGVSVTLLSGYSITMAIANLLFLPFIIFYLAVDFRQLHQNALSFFPMLKRAKIKALFMEMDGYVSAFVRGQLLVCFVLFVLYAVGLGLVGVELWFLLAVIAGFGNIVPYLGFVAGIILSSIMALVTFGDLSHLLMVWGVFALVQFLEGTFITPRILGEKVGLSPLAIMLALFAGGTLFGLLGIFLAVPVAAVLRVLISHLSTWVIQRA